MRNVRFLFILSLFYSLALNCEEEKFHPFDITASHDSVGSSKITKPYKWRHHDFSYSSSLVLASYKQRLESQELRYGIGALNSHFGWDKRPRIKQRNFDNLLLNFATSGIYQDDWHADGWITAQINPDNSSLFRTLFLLGALNGKYAWNETSNFHFGLVGCTGMHFTRLLPIIGIDTKYGEKIRLNLVFPTNVSAFYSFNDNWTVNATLRIFLSRQRLKENEHGHLKRGFVLYDNLGGEVGLSYKINERLFAGVHIGETIGGRIRTSNRHNSHKKETKLGGSLYWGFGATLSL